MFLPRHNQASNIMQMREFYNAVGSAIRKYGHIGARNDFANPDLFSQNQRVNNIS